MADFFGEHPQTVIWLLIEYQSGKCGVEWSNKLSENRNREKNAEKKRNLKVLLLVIANIFGILLRLLVVRQIFVQLSNFLAQFPRRSKQLLDLKKQKKCPYFCC